MNRFTVKGTRKDGETVDVYGGDTLEYLYQAFDVVRKEWETGSFRSLVIVKRSADTLEKYELRELHE